MEIGEKGESEMKMSSVGSGNGSSVSYKTCCDQLAASNCNCICTRFMDNSETGCIYRHSWL